MNLLITPAMRLTQEKKQILSKDHHLFFIDSELTPLANKSLGFSPNDIDGIVCNHFFTANDLSVLPNLRFLQLASAGLDRVPLQKIKEKKIALYNAGSIYAVPIAEWVIGQILADYKREEYFWKLQKERAWKKNRSLRELSHSSAVIIGYGNIGRAVAKRLKAFDVSILAVDLFYPNGDLSFDEYYDLNKIKEAIAKADIIVLSAPLTEDTYHIIDGDLLACMKEDALLINPSRGPLIDENALIEFVQHHPDFHAVLDVFEKEPLPDDSFFWDCMQVKVSPHNAFESPRNADRMFELLLRNLKDYAALSI